MQVLYCTHIHLYTYLYIVSASLFRYLQFYATSQKEKDEWNLNIGLKSNPEKS